MRSCFVLIAWVLLNAATFASRDNLETIPNPKLDSLSYNRLLDYARKLEAEVQRLRNRATSSPSQADDRRQSLESISKDEFPPADQSSNLFGTVVRSETIPAVTYVQQKVIPTGFSQPRSVVYTTYATHANREFCFMAYSALRNGITPNIVGWGGVNVVGHPPQEGRYLNMHRPPALGQLSSSLIDRNNTIVIWADSMDVLIVKPIEDIVASFLSIGHPLVLSSERGCCGTPQSSLCDVDESRWPIAPAPSKSRYLNAGGMVGFGQSVRKLAKDVRRTFQRFKDNAFFHKTDDQGPLCEVIASRRLKHNATIDYHSSIFQSLFQWNRHWYSDGSSSDWHWQGVGEISIDDSTGEVINHESNTRPAILHFNGKDEKMLLVPFVRRLNWAASDDFDQISQRELFFVGQGPRSLKDVCRGQDFSISKIMKDEL